jgi:hypothetical protein
MAIAYWTVAGITFSIILRAFLKDGTPNKINLQALVFIGTATVLWPMTLPFIVSSKLRAAKARHQANASEQAMGRAHTHNRAEPIIVLNSLRN